MDHFKLANDYLKRAAKSRYSDNASHLALCAIAEMMMGEIELKYSIDGLRV